METLGVAFALVGLVFSVIYVVLLRSGLKSLKEIKHAIASSKDSDS